MDRLAPGHAQRRLPRGKPLPLYGNAEVQETIWSGFAHASSDGGPGIFVFGWSLATIGLVVAALVTPGGALGAARQRITAGALLCYAAGDALLMATGVGNPEFGIFAARYVLVTSLAAGAGAAWLPRRFDSDAREIR